MADGALLLTKLDPPQPRPGHVFRSHLAAGCTTACTGA